MILSISGRGWLTIGLSVAAVAVACGGVWWWRGPTPAFPEVHLDGAEPQVVATVKREVERVRADPRSADAWGRFGKVLFTHNFDDAALHCFEVAHRFDPRDPRWPYFQGVHYAQREPERAEGLLRLAAQLNDRAGPDNIAPRMRLVELLLAQGKLDDAEKELALVPAPSHPRVRYALGLLDFQRGRWQQALDRFVAVRDHPIAGRLMAGPLAMAYQRLGQPDKAAEVARFTRSSNEVEVTWEDPFLAEANSLNVGSRRRLQLSAVAQDMGGMKESIAVLRQMIEDSGGKDHVALFSLGNAYMTERQYPEAVAAFRRAVAVAPDQYRLVYRLSVALFNQGEQLVARGQPEAARRLFQESADVVARAVALQPQEAWGQFQLGRSRMLLGEHAAAVEPLRKAVLGQPENARFHCHLAEALAEVGQADEARRCLERGVRIAPSNDPLPGEIRARLEKKWAGKGK